MGTLAVVILVASLVLGYLKREDEYVLGVAMAFAGYAITVVVTRLAGVRNGLFWPAFLARTLYRYREVRVSIAYLIGISVGGEQLLIRGHRITTQFQPVGGVFKVHLSEAELSRRFNARTDSRFTPDEKSSGDLRLRLPGRDVSELLRWFDSKKDRELFPWREFYEELVGTKILNPADFPYFDCTFLGVRHLPLRFDRYSQCPQLIVAEVYELRPTPAQVTALQALRDSVRAGGNPDIYFANHEEINRGGIVSGSRTTFDISPTTRWLISS
ncbi:hypothetical protein ACFOW4_12170 [Micromonospora sp. GCM10011542]|uniref:SMODS-associated NUDIX domain-containing protein n=1 Tax=Micromonospora sp. GCM10011542 TaxID=3317337 RepID=UPI00361B8BF7